MPRLPRLIAIIATAVTVVLSPCALPLPAAAGDGSAAPLPARKTHTLDRLQSDLKEKKADESRLAGEVEKAQKELRATRDTLKETAALARKNEQDLLALEKRIAALSAEQKDLSARLEADYGSMADLILALERLRRVPPEALIVRPGAPLQTAQTALLLQSVLPAIDNRAERLSADLRRLRAIGAQLEADRAAALAAKADLDRKYSDIKSLADRRETLYRDLNRDYRETAAAAERIAREARTMQEFMARLAEEKRLAAARAQAEAKAQESGRSAGGRKSAAARAVSGGQEDMPRAGRPRLPVAGIVLTGFGQKDLIGAVSQGMTIEARENGLALTPIGGIVRYAGHFKNYGQMVILEHKDSYHSLIGGLGAVSVGIGQSLEAGEPLGKLPSSSSRGGKPALYYELRHKGRPVNPTDKFPDLRS